MKKLFKVLVSVLIIFLFLPANRIAAEEYDVKCFNIDSTIQSYLGVTRISGNKGDEVGIVVCNGFNEIFNLDKISVTYTDNGNNNKSITLNYDEEKEYPIYFVIPNDIKIGSVINVNASDGYFNHLFVPVSVSSSEQGTVTIRGYRRKTGAGNLLDLEITPAEGYVLNENEWYATYTDKDGIVTTLGSFYKIKDNLYRIKMDTVVGNSNDGGHVNLYVVPDYLTFTAEEENSTLAFSWNSGSDVMIRTKPVDGNWSDWSAYTAGSTITLASVGDQVSFKAKNIKTDIDHKFTMSGKIAASGNISSLTDGFGCTNVDLSSNSCSYMFKGCSALTKTPSIIANTISTSCEEMFAGCTGLTSVSKISYESAVSDAMKSMFCGCKQLVIEKLDNGHKSEATFYVDNKTAWTTAFSEIPQSHFININEVSSTPSAGYYKISIASLSVEVDDKVYDGTTDATGTVKGILEGDENYISTVATFDTETVGEDKTGTIAYTLTGDAVGAYFLDTTFTADISQKPLSISTDDGKTTTVADKIYDGTTTAQVTKGTVLGVVEGDEVTVGIVSADFSDKNVGKNKDVTITYSISGKDADNYTKPADEIKKATINAKQLYVTGTKADGKDYDGNDDAKAYLGTVSGIIGTEDVTVEIDSAKFSDKNVKNGKDITISYKISGSDAGNYKKPDNDTTTADIEAKQLTVNGTSVNSKTYDGTTNATINKGTISGIIEGDNTTVSASGTFKDKNAGANKEVSVTYSISGTHANNYIAPKTETKNADISPKSLTITGYVVSDKYYDGTNKAIVTNNGTLGNIVQGDDVNIDTVTANYIDDTVANDKQVTIQYTLKGTDKDNYTLADQTTTSSILAIPSIDSNKSNVNIDNQKFSITLTKGNTKDIVIDIDDTYSSTCKAELYKDDTMVQECICSQGSIKVTIPNSYVKTLAVGTHDFTLKVTNANNLSYTYDLAITINNPVISPTYNVVKTGVEETTVSPIKLVSLLSLVAIAGVAVLKKRKY